MFAARGAFLLAIYMNTIKYFVKRYMPNKVHIIASNLKSTLNYYKYFKILKNLYYSVSSNDIGNERIVFNLVRSHAEGPLFFESFLATKLHELGAKTNILIDDGVLRHHDSVQYQDFIKINDVVFRTKIASNFLKRIPLYKKYSEFIDRNGLKEVSLIADSFIKKNKYFYKNINLKPYIDSSVIRYFKSAIGFPEKECGYNKIFKICTENAVISILVALKVEELLNPDIIITSHGIYSTWGPFYKYFKQKGRKVITYGFSGCINNGVIFSKKGLVTNKHDDGFFNSYKDKIDIRVAKENIKNVFNKRFKGESDDLIRYNNFTNNNNILRKVKDVIEGRKAFALFPNVFWDASLTNTNSIFNSPEEWIIETIKYFMKRKDKILIIRVHPSETIFTRTCIGIKEIIESKIKKDISNINNIQFIPSNNSLISYSLFPYIKGAIVYNGTIGLEAMYKNIPVFIAGKAPYSNKGFSIDFKNKEEYFQAFNKPEKILKYQEYNKENLIKFLFYYFTLNEIPLSFLNEKKPAYPKLNYIPSMILNDKNLKYIAETILDKHDFFQEWHWNES